MSFTLFTDTLTLRNMLSLSLIRSLTSTHHISRMLHTPIRHYCFYCVLFVRQLRTCFHYLVESFESKAPIPARWAEAPRVRRKVSKKVVLGAFEAGVLCDRVVERAVLELQVVYPFDELHRELVENGVGVELDQLEPASPCWMPAHFRREDGLEHLRTAARGGGRCG
jgi:hypothetical protein